MRNSAHISLPVNLCSTGVLTYLLWLVASFVGSLVGWLVFSVGLLFTYYN
jgi:hypothetical protein